MNIYKYHSFYTVNGEYKNNPIIEHLSQEEENANDLIKIKYDNKYIIINSDNINNYILTSDNNLTENSFDATEFTIINNDNENVEIKYDKFWLTSNFTISNQSQFIKYNKDNDTLSFTSLLNNSNNWEIEYTNTCYPNINEAFNSILNSLNNNQLSEFNVIKDEEGDNIFKNPKLDQIYQILNLLINSNL